MSYRKFHRLRVRLAEMDITQQEAARMAGLAPSTLTTRMTGRVPFNINEVQALCEVLNIPTEQIGAFFFEDGPRQQKGE